MVYAPLLGAMEEGCRSTSCVHVPLPTKRRRILTMNVIVSINHAKNDVHELYLFNNCCRNWCVHTSAVFFSTMSSCLKKERVMSVDTDFDNLLGDLSSAIADLESITAVSEEKGKEE